MAYRFGQFRREQFSEYIKSLEKIGFINIQTEDKQFTGQKFTDVALVREFTPSDGSLFFRFALTRFDRNTGVTIKLAKENTSALSTDNTQTIARFTVPAALTADQFTVPIVYDIIITPNDTYAKLIITIDRDGTDIKETPRMWVANQGIMIDTFGQIQNVITAAAALDTEGVDKLKQIGVQSRPGLPMCINGEMIRVGRSGIYEINHGIEIKFLGFMPNDNDHFILDYQY